MSQARLVAARCGRRWGKNVVGESVAIDDASHGRLVGWFAPENKRLSESYEVIVSALEPIKKRSDKTHGIIRTVNGGAVEFWSLEDENAGRSRKYHRIILDEGAFTKPKTIDWWTKSAKPTLLDYAGRALVMSNTNGIDPDNFFYDICNEPKHGFVQFHAPTHSNPHLPADEVAKLITDNLPLVYQQEHLAEFVDWSGEAFFSIDSLLVNGRPIDQPLKCDAVFAIIDTATKTGKKNDGTGVVYFAFTQHAQPPLVVLDWDLVQIEGDLLITWLPQVFDQLERYAMECGARGGSVGALIEDKNSGSILLQQAGRRDMPARAIESKLTDMGKDERAISVSGYVYRQQVKFAPVAHDKVSVYKGTTRNHLRGQVVGFRVGDKDATREDDLLDCFDGLTEVLTDQGWKRFADLNRAESLATVNLATDFIEYQWPTAYVERDHHGDVIEIKGKRVDICVTPNHRMIVENTNAIWRGEYRPRVKLAKDLTAASILKNTSRWIGTRQPVVIQAWTYEGAKAGAMPEIVIDRALMAEFVGWFLAEGSLASSSFEGSVKRRVIISQMPGPKADMIEALLRKMPFKYGKPKTAGGCHNFNITSAQLHRFLSDCYEPGDGRPCYRKRVPAWVLESSPDVLERFFDAVVKGDGWEQAGHRTVATTSPAFADHLQECLVKMGRASTMKVRRDLPPTKLRGGLGNKSATQYHVNEIRSKYVFPVNRRTNTSLVTRRPYSGKVYCASVPNGTLILRRNGKTFVAGNCFTYGIAVALGNAEGF